MQRQQWPFELNLIRIREDELIYSRKAENVEAENNKNRFAPKALSEKYVFSPSAYLCGKWLYKNMETARTNHLWLAWWFSFCTHKFSCAENVLRKGTIISGLYMLLRTPLKWLLRRTFEDKSIPKEKSFTQSKSFIGFEFVGLFALTFIVAYDCIESYLHDAWDKKWDKKAWRIRMVA